MELIYGKYASAYSLSGCISYAARRRRVVGEPTGYAIETLTEDIEVLTANDASEKN